MQYKLFSIFALFLVALPLVFSAELKDIVQHCYENSDGTNKWLDYRGNNSINLTQSVKKNQSGLYREDNESITFASASTADWGMFNTTIYLDNQSEGAICSWFNVTEDPDDTLFFIGDPSSNSVYAQFKVNTDGVKDQMAFQIIHTNANNVVVFSSGSNFELGAPQFACIGYNNGTYWAYHNGTNKSVSFEAGNHAEGWFRHIINAGNSITSANIGVRDRAVGRDHYLNGNYGKLYILNGTPTTEQLGNLSNFTASTPQGIKPMNCSSIFATGGGGGGGADPTKPVVNGSLNTSRIFLNDYINATFNATDDTNLTFGQVIINHTGAKEYYNFTLNGSGLITLKFWQNFTIACSAGCVVNITGRVNDSSGNQNQNTTIITVSGISAPNITIHGNNFFASDNSTIISFNRSKSALLNFTMTDDVDLLGFEINITNSSGNLFFNFTNISFSGVSATFTRIINVSGPQGRYNVSIEVVDSHTAAEISEWKIRKSTDWLEFDSNIRIEAENAIWASTSKYIDRYSFEFYYLPIFTPKTKIFYVESSSYLIYVNTSGYKAHFVDFKNGKWIDFEGVNGTPKITRINEKRYKVEFAHQGSSISFNSIGGLNRNVFYYSYYLSNPSIKWHKPDGEKHTFARDSIFVSFNVTGNGRNNTLIYLYNSTDEVVSNVSVVDNGTGTYFYNATFTIAFVDYSYKINATHIDINKENVSLEARTFENLILTNTSSFGAYPGINFTILDEVNSSRIRGTATARFDYNGTSSQLKIFNMTSNDADNFTAYIFPARESVTNDYSVTYSATGYQQRVLTIEDAVFTNVTQTRTLFLLASSEGISANFKVLDAFQAAISGAIATMKTSSGTIIESRTTDDAGAVSFFLNPDTTYIFVFEKSGFKTSTNTLRVTTSDFITVTLESDTSEQVTSYFTGISYYFSPQSVVLSNNTNYTFSFNLTSSFWNMTGCTLRLKNNSETLTSTSCFYNISKLNASILFFTGNQSLIISEAIYQINNTINATLSKSYKVQWQYKGRFSLRNFLDGVTSFTEGGFDDFARFLIGIFITLIVVGIISLQSADYREPEILIPAVLIMILFFSYLGWFNVPYNIPTTLQSFMKSRTYDPNWLQQYIVFILTSLTGIAFIIKRNL